MSKSIEVKVCEGTLCADFNEGRLIIDTGSPVSLGPDIAVRVLGSVVQLNSSFGSYAWAEIQDSLPFDAVGLIGIDAFSDATLGFDIANQTVVRLESSIEGVQSSFVMGSPVIDCQIGEDKMRCVLDTGAGLSYLKRHEVAGLGQPLGNQHDFHPMLGSFEVETVACPIVVGGQSLTETFGLATEQLGRLMDAAGIDAILGTSFFGKSVVEIDFKNEVIGIALG